MNEKRSPGRQKAELSEELKGLVEYIRNHEGVRRHDLLDALGLESDNLKRIVKNSKNHGLLISVGNSYGMRYYTREHADLHGIKPRKRSVSKGKTPIRRKDEPDPVHVDWVNRNRIFSECMNRSAAL